MNLPQPPLAIAAVLLFSPDPERLARFYQLQLGIPLELIQIPGHDPHWACDIREVYISIWPSSAEEHAPEQGLRNGVAFYVVDVKREFERLVANGIPVDFEPKRSGLGIIARLRDPDGNPFELYQPAI